MSWENLSVDDLADAIDSEGFHSAAQMFKDQEIQGCVIPLITDEHLKEMGISPVGTRLKLIKFLKKLCNATRVPSRQKMIDDQVFEETTTQRSYAQQTQPVKTRQVPAPAPQNRAAQMGQTQPRAQKQSASTKRPTTAQPGASKDGEVPKYVRDHQKMVESIRAARKYAAYEKAVEEGRAVGPPPELPAFEEPEGLVQCPTCGRKMSEEAAKHHFPVCERMTYDKANRMKTGKY